MNRAIDLTGQKLNRWTVLNYSHKTKSRKIYWLCECDCGTKKAVLSESLRSGASKSCGCLHKEKVTTHGQTKSRTFNSWSSMKQRCLNSNSPDYHRYGGRGITVCSEWVNDYCQFLKDMGERPLKHSLDRIDVNGNYEPENCKWSTRSQQQANKVDSPRLTHDGKTLTVYDWSKISGVDVKAIMWRVKNGWSIEQSIMKPKRNKTKEIKL